MTYIAVGRAGAGRLAMVYRANTPIGDILEVAFYRTRKDKDLATVHAYMYVWAYIPSITPSLSRGMPTYLETNKIPKFIDRGPGRLRAPCVFAVPQLYGKRRKQMPSAGIEPGRNGTDTE